MVYDRANATPFPYYKEKANQTQSEEATGTTTSAQLSTNQVSPIQFMAEKGQPLPKFGEWDVNDPASAENYTMIFNEARNEKKAGVKSSSLADDNSTRRNESSLGKPQSKTWFCCIQSAHAES